VSEAWVIACCALAGLVLAPGVVLLGMLDRAAVDLERTRAELERLSPPRPGGLEPGSLVPDFAIIDTEGRVLPSSDLGARPCIYLLLSTGCLPCRDLLESLRTSAGPGTIPVVGVLDATAGDDIAAIPTPAWMTLYRQSNASAAIALQSTVTPHAFGVDADRRVVAAGIPRSADDLQAIGEMLRPHSAGARAAGFAVANRAVQGAAAPPGRTSAAPTARARRS
jgi:hypothetical protein